MSNYKNGVQSTGVTYFTVLADLQIKFFFFSLRAIFNVCFIQITINIFRHVRWNKLNHLSNIPAFFKPIAFPTANFHQNIDWVSRQSKQIIHSNRSICSQVTKMFSRFAYVPISEHRTHKKTNLFENSHSLSSILNTE